MRRAGALTVLLLVALVAGLKLWPSDPGPPAEVRAGSAAPHAATRSATTAASRPSPPPDHHTVPVRDSAGDFKDRLRCVDARSLYRGLAAADVLAMLCAGQPLDALRVEMSLAEAGDLHALRFMVIMISAGGCGTGPAPGFAGYRTRALERARASGATPETLSRLDGVLSDEQHGPSAGERAACRQATDELRKLRPAVLQQITAMPDHAADGGKQIDAGLEFARMMTVSGEARDEEDLADALLLKDTPEAQAEAVTLLRDAARSSASAKSALAGCLLDGCPTPATETDEARQLLASAAAEGDLQALRMLAGEAAVVSGAQAAMEVPVAERFAWSELLHRLQAEGCFGSTMFDAWAMAPQPPSALNAMSPADADAAQARAAELLARQLAPTRMRLGCD